MPGFNQRGPMNQGPMTGRGMGRCTGNQPSAGAGYGYGYGMGNRCRRGFGAGFQNRFQGGGGGGRGFGRNFEAAPMADSQEDLKSREAILEQELAAIRQQMKNQSDPEE